MCVGAPSPQGEGEWECPFRSFRVFHMFRFYQKHKKYGCRFCWTKRNERKQMDSPSPSGDGALNTHTYLLTDTYTYTHTYAYVAMSHLIEDFGESESRGTP